MFSCGTAGAHPAGPDVSAQCQPHSPAARLKTVCRVVQECPHLGCKKEGQRYLFLTGSRWSRLGLPARAVRVLRAGGVCCRRRADSAAPGPPKTHLLLSAHKYPVWQENPKLKCVWLIEQLPRRETQRVKECTNTQILDTGFRLLNK